MKKIYLLIIPLFIVACKSKTSSKRTAATQKNIHKTIKVKAIPLDSLSHLLGIDLHPINAKFKGHYSIVYEEDKPPILDGPFYFSFADSTNTNPATADTGEYYKYSLSYKGNFSKGEFHGSLTEDWHFDDGIDNYSAWKITLNYFNAACHYATFDGAIGFVMPKSKYTFHNLTHCSFLEVEQKAWEQWRETFTKSKP